MAARNQNVAEAQQLQQNNRVLGGAGVPALGKQKAAMAGRPDPKNNRRALGDIGNVEANNRRALGDIGNVEANNRRALGDIGNVEANNRRALGDLANVINVRAAEGKPQLHEPVNRPVTRNFGAQLLKNAQEKAKNPAARPAARRAHAKPAPALPEHMIEISSDSDVSARQQPEGSVSSVRKYSRKKEVNTLTFVLSARSKFAAGITEEPLQVIQDIDKLDGDNQLAVVDYIEDIYKFYKVAENSCRPCDYMDSQVEINAKMRGILADWIIEVHQKFDLMPETLYLTVYIIDMYLTVQPVLRRELQLVGVSALLIACKYEEIWAPEVNDFILISDSAYTREQVLRMEKAILNRLEWNLTVPTPYVFLVRFAKCFAKAASSSDLKNDMEMENMVFFFAELALVQYALVLSKPSFVAAAAVYAARLTLKKTPLWTDTLKHHTGFTESQLMDTAKILVTSHSTAPGSKLKVVYKKYSSEKLGAVALRPPAIDFCK